MDFGSLTFVDYAVIAILLLSTFFAFMRGFIGSFLSLAGWVLSIYLAYTLFPQVKPYLDEKINSPIIVIIAGHTALLVGFLIVFGVLNLLATAAVKGLTSGVIDRILGVGFGVIRGGVIVSFIFLALVTGIGILQGSGKTFEVKDDVMPKWLTKARSYEAMKDGGAILASYIPDSFYTRFQEMYDDISKKTMDDRFVENSIQKLKKSLNPQQVKLIEENAEEAALSESYEENKYHKVRNMLESYEKTPPQEGSPKNGLSKEEATRLKKILSQKQKDLANAKTKIQDPLEDIPTPEEEHGE